MCLEFCSVHETRSSNNDAEAADDDDLVVYSSRTNDVNEGGSRDGSSWSVIRCSVEEEDEVENISRE